MAKTIAELWAERLENHDEKYNNFNQVPVKLRDKVRAIIEADGYVINEDGSVTKAEDEDLSI